MFLPKGPIWSSIEFAAEVPLAAVDEVYAVVLDVEPDKVAVQHPLQHLVVPGQDLEDVPGGEGYVQEEGNLTVDLFLISNLNTLYIWYRYIF